MRVTNGIPLGCSLFLPVHTCKLRPNTEGKSAAQVALRWLVQHKVTFSTESKSEAHFKDDLAIFDFELSVADMAILDKKAHN
jgi:diketogulonate reductase-like aldo/keto reductase